jgi:TorA maturation chaperone TorD
MTELIRALATLAEPPTDRTPRLAHLLGMKGAPTPPSYTDLFLFQQTPYASAYLGDDGMIGGEPRDRVAGFWRALGLVAPPEPDHLATLLRLCGDVRTERRRTGSRRRDRLTRARHAFLWSTS